jgi:hypothetical protein
MTNPKMKKLKMTLQITNKIYTGYFTNDNKADGIENVTHNTFAKQTWHLG